MTKSWRGINPFYVLLVAVGIVFVVTACAYAVMVVKNIEPARRSGPSNPLMDLMDQHGGGILVIEVVLLGVATAAAITTDSYWTRKAARSDEE